MKTTTFKNWNELKGMTWKFYGKPGRAYDDGHIRQLMLGSTEVEAEGVRKCPTNMKKC